MVIGLPVRILFQLEQIAILCIIMTEHSRALLFLAPFFFPIPHPFIVSSPLFDEPFELNLARPLAFAKQRDDFPRRISPVAYIAFYAELAARSVPRIRPLDGVDDVLDVDTMELGHANRNPS